jgi:hypothetical protein
VSYSDAAERGAAAVMAKAEPAGKQGRPTKTEGKLGNAKVSEKGTTAAYLAARLKRDHPEIAAAVERMDRLGGGYRLSGFRLCRCRTRAPSPPTMRPRQEGPRNLAAGLRLAPLIHGLRHQAVAEACAPHWCP